MFPRSRDQTRYAGAVPIVIRSAAGTGHAIQVAAAGEQASRQVRVRIDAGIHHAHTDALAEIAFLIYRRRVDLIQIPLAALVPGRDRSAAVCFFKFSLKTGIQKLRIPVWFVPFQQPGAVKAKRRFLAHHIERMGAVHVHQPGGALLVFDDVVRHHRLRRTDGKPGQQHDCKQRGQGYGSERRCRPDMFHNMFLLPFPAIPACGAELPAPFCALPSPCHN